jgi:hypothetical protein
MAKYRTGIDEQRPVTRRQKLDILTSWAADRRNEGNESSRREIGCQRLIDVLKSSHKGSRYGETSPGISPADSGEECRTNAVPSYVGEADNYLAVRKAHPVEVITTGFIRRLVPSGNFKSRDLRRLLRQERSLD